MFIGVIELPSGGVIAKSSASLTVGEFVDYVMAVEAHIAAEFGFVSNYGEVEHG